MVISRNKMKPFLLESQSNDSLDDLITKVYWNYLIKPKKKDTNLLIERLPMGYKLLEPIPYILRFENGEFIARIPSLEIISFSDNFEDTNKDLIIQVTELIDELRDFKTTDLGSKPKKWLDFLNYHIG